MSHLDTYRTQSGPQTRRERVQPTATGPLQSPLCVRGRRNPARDPRFPITADPHPSPHLTLDSTASRLTCPLTCATAPPETATGTAAASTAATTGEEVRRPNHLRSAGAFFPTRPLTHSQTNTRCLSPTRGATRVAHVIARYRPRSRRDAPVDGPPMGLPSGARAHGRMHASRRASRASFRASLSSETLNSERSLAFPCLFGCESEHDFSPSSRRTSSTHPSIHTSIRC